MIDFVLLCWLFAIGITAHNIEEALRLPAWSRTAGRWARPVGAGEFRFALVVLTIPAYAGAYFVSVTGQNSPAAYFVTGYALAMLLNVVVPHVAVTVIMRRYAPGTATAVVFNLPITTLLLYQGIQTHYIQVSTFAWVGPLVVLAILGSIPVLFALGKRLTRNTPPVAENLPTHQSGV